MSMSMLSCVFIVKEKHQSMAAVKSGEDKIEALETELDYLKVQLKVGGGSSSAADSSTTEFPSGTSLIEPICCNGTQIFSLLCNRVLIERSYCVLDVGEVIVNMFLMLYFACLWVQNKSKI